MENFNAAISDFSEAIKLNQTNEHYRGALRRLLVAVKEFNEIAQGEIVRYLQ